MTAALLWLALAQRVLACEWVARRGHDGWCETHDDPWPCGRAQEAAEVLAEELDQPTKEQKMSKTTGPWTEHISAALSNAPMTPIDPADIRPGDVVRIVYTGTCEEIDSSYRVIRTTEGDAFDMENTDVTWHLVHRPDPDAEAVQAIRSASYNIWRRGERMDPLPGLTESLDLLAKLRERGWDVVRRAES